MRNRFFFMYLFSALIFLISCSAFSGAKDREVSNLTDEQRLKIINTIKSKLGGDSKKIARVDKYFYRFSDSKRDVILQLFSIGFEYINSKESQPTESENRKSDLDALKSDFESKLKQLNYTAEDFEKLSDEFNKFVESD
ncbi:hypothetical protein SAMN02983004_00875 [Borreliella japonica]|uniref:Lipoprotein n=1 Tax=Borreliella japonica TaxID=34095 RepID=A0A1G4Q2W8_BORJA|nr:hypothetical protein [Borreliella japonica]WKC88591.1 hypothetical protein QIA20_00370 [Borreliella japonica]SCW38519.1 hypothetical protein SAMN02983004_00875 [Borreliella japonica]